MQASQSPRIRCSSVLLLLSSTFFYFFSPNSQPSSLREKGPFASLARLPISTAIDLIPWLFLSFILFLPSSPSTALDGSFSFGHVKDRAVAMGKPHCNRSIRTFLVIKIVRDFILVLPSVKFRVLPWPMLYLILALFPSVAKPIRFAKLPILSK